MKTYMPLDGFRWSCDSDSALCDILQTNVFGRTGGVNAQAQNVNGTPQSATTAKGQMYRGVVIDDED